MKFLSSTILLIMLMANYSQAYEAKGKQCITLDDAESREFTLNASINQYTVIKLPDLIKPRTKPLIGNPDLWDVEHAGYYIYIKPLTDKTKMGAITNINVITEKNINYNFSVKRVSNANNKKCYVFSKPDDAEAPEFTSNLTANTVTRSQYLADINRLNAKYQEDVEKRVNGALKRYRNYIYTRYTINESYNSPVKVDTVFDDGRFTYIRLNQDNMGLLTLEAEVNGKQELIEMQYDALSKLYTASGIYPKLKLKNSDYEIKIIRKDNYSLGGY